MRTAGVFSQIGALPDSDCGADSSLTNVKIVARAPSAPLSLETPLGIPGARARAGARIRVGVGVGVRMRIGQRARVRSGTKMRARC